MNHEYLFLRLIVTMIIVHTSMWEHTVAHGEYWPAISRKVCDGFTAQICPRNRSSMQWGVMYITWREEGLCSVLEWEIQRNRPASGSDSSRSGHCLSRLSGPACEFWWPRERERERESSNLAYWHYIAVKQPTELWAKLFYIMHVTDLSQQS